MPLLLDLLPTGLTLSLDDFVPVVCFTGAVLTSVALAGPTLLSPEVVGVFQSAQVSGYVLTSPGAEGVVLDGALPVGGFVLPVLQLRGEVVGLPEATGIPYISVVEGIVTISPTVIGSIAGSVVSGSVVADATMGGAVKGKCRKADD